MSLTITATGTLTPPPGVDRSWPQVVGQPVGGSGVAFKNSGGTAFDSRIGLQRGINLFDEFNQFVAILAGALGVPGFVVLDQIRLIVSDSRRQPTMGERAYAP